ncbi:nucleotide-binding oligomerization domain-containing protein 1-like isoform X2 [Dysidea avara]|uniref:nucleotide-binding oligomerization domain-containing protein 1-like isoform X2 n=1 Tax=Dysidea avara TaxID=196820 RepID=UPI0033168315
MANQSEYEELEQFKEIYKGTTPQLKDLQNHITPRYGARWRVIGALLGLTSGALDIIKYDNHDKAEPCCDAVFEKWLEEDPSASWGKLNTVLKSPALTSDQADPGANAISVLSERVSQTGKQARFASDEDAWPPNQPKDFTPLLLVHHQDNGSSFDLLDTHESLREVLDVSKITKQLVDILAPLEENSDPQFILVEGLPGIGKSLLLKEILYQWSIKQLLQSFKLVLLVQLRDPDVQQASDIDSLLTLFYKRHRKAPEITAACSEYLAKNAGIDLVFLFDGFDELPEKLRKKGLVAEILKREVLPCCSIVVSSRPHASVKLRQQATVKVNILGFAEEERKLYIEQSLKEHPQKVKELTEYLESHLTINSLCYVPFIMVALLYIYSQGISLPSNAVDLYRRFICLTICRHLARSGHSDNDNITNLTDLPEPCNTIVKQLAKFSLMALNDNKLIFTLKEIKAVCSGITDVPEAINGFGLLQAVQHFGFTAKTTTFNFLHFSIQEFLAAYHVSQLPASQELILLQEKFWSNIHANMFSIYTTLTEGQRPAFKKFLRHERLSFLQIFKQFFTRGRGGVSGKVAISEEFLNHQTKCVYLFRCFHDAGDEEICQSLENSNCFIDKKFEICKTSLSPYDVECVTHFLTFSTHKEWMLLNLKACHIQDHGLRVMTRDLLHSDVAISQLNLSSNSLTRSSSSSIRDLTIHCKVRSLLINRNHTIGEDPALFDILFHPSSKLVELSMWKTSLSSSSTIVLFTSLAKGQKLQRLAISYDCNIEEACNVIASSLQTNTSLLDLRLVGGKIRVDIVQCLVQAIHHNNTLQRLWLPHYSEYFEEMHICKLLQEEVNRSRERRRCYTKLYIRY